MNSWVLVLVCIIYNVSAFANILEQYFNLNQNLNYLSSNSKELKVPKKPDLPLPIPPKAKQIPLPKPPKKDVSKKYNLPLPETPKAKLVKPTNILPGEYEEIQNKIIKYLINNNFHELAVLTKSKNLVDPKMTQRIREVINNIKTDDNLSILNSIILSEFTSSNDNELLGKSRKYVDEYLRKSRRNLLRFALSYAKADPNIVDESGKTPLMSAVLTNEWDLIKILIKFKADVNKKDESGKTALFYANYFPSDESLETMKILLENGADVNIKDNKNMSVLDYLIKEYRSYSPENLYSIINLLLEHNANICNTDKGKKILDEAKKLTSDNIKTIARIQEEISKKCK